MSLRELFGIEVPLIQAPMAGVQDSALAVAASNAGALGSLPCAMLTLEGMRAELETLKAQTSGPLNVNFFVHTPPAADAARDARWREALSPYYREISIDAAMTPPGPGRTPVSSAAADVLAEFKPAVASLHFGRGPASRLGR